MAPKGWANLTLQGSKADAALQFDYAPQNRTLIPILKQLDLSFEAVDVETTFINVFIVVREVNMTENTYNVDFL